MSEQMPNHAVAIIGMAGRFPDARNLDEFWRNISSGIEVLDTVTEAEMDACRCAERVCVRIRISCQSALRLRAQTFSTPVFLGCRLAKRKFLILNSAFSSNARGRHSKTRAIRQRSLEQSVGVYAGASMNSYCDPTVAQSRVYRDASAAIRLCSGTTKTFSVPAYRTN